MLALLLPLLVLPAASAPQDPPPPPPPVEEEKQEQPDPAEAAQAIADALKSKDDALAEGALRNFGRIADAAVVKAVGGAIKHEQPAVRLAAVEALRFNPHEDALALLLKQKSNKKLHDDPVTAAAFAYALGQKRDKKAIPLLEDGLVATGDTNNKVMSAKIYALGRIRDEESCEVLMDFLNSAALVTEKYMTEVRASMTVLTGVDVGRGRHDWLDWWREHKSSIKILAEEPPLENAFAAAAWKRMWATPEEIEAWKKERRGEGGGEGEGGDAGGKPPPRRERPPAGGGA